MNTVLRGVRSARGLYRPHRAVGLTELVVAAGLIALILASVQEASHVGAVASKKGVARLDDVGKLNRLFERLKRCMRTVQKMALTQPTPGSRRYDLLYVHAIDEGTRTETLRNAWLEVKPLTGNAVEVSFGKDGERALSYTFSGLKLFLYGEAKLVGAQAIDERNHRHAFVVGAPSLGEVRGGIDGPEHMASDATVPAASGPLAQPLGGAAPAAAAVAPPSSRPTTPESGRPGGLLGAAPPRAASAPPTGRITPNVIAPTRPQTPAAAAPPGPMAAAAPPMGSRPPAAAGSPGPTPVTSPAAGSVTPVAGVRPDKDFDSAAGSPARPAAAATPAPLPTPFGPGVWAAGQSVDVASASAPASTPVDDTPTPAPRSGTLGATARSAGAAVRPQAAAPPARDAGAAPDRAAIAAAADTRIQDRTARRPPAAVAVGSAAAASTNDPFDD